MAFVKVIALTRIHKSRPGDVMQVRDREAKFLIQSGLAKPFEESTEPAAPQVASAPVAQPVVVPPIVQPTEPMAPLPTDVPADDVPDPPKPTPRGRRNYRTSELKAGE